MLPLEPLHFQQKKHFIGDKNWHVVLSFQGISYDNTGDIKWFSILLVIITFLDFEDIYLVYVVICYCGLDLFLLVNFWLFVVVEKFHHRKESQENHEKLYTLK